MAAEVDEVDLLLDPQSELRRIGCRFVWILGIATEHVEQFFTTRNERDVRDLETIVGGVVRERVRREACVGRSREREPEVAAAAGIARPREGATPGRCDDVGGEWRAQDLLESNAAGYAPGVVSSSAPMRGVAKRLTVTCDPFLRKVASFWHRRVCATSHTRVHRLTV
jgi:hypothetical protein